MNPAAAEALPADRACACAARPPSSASTTSARSSTAMPRAGERRSAIDRASTGRLEALGIAECRKLVTFGSLSTDFMMLFIKLRGLLSPGTAACRRERSEHLQLHGPGDPLGAHLQRDLDPVGAIFCPGSDFQPQRDRATPAGSERGHHSEPAAGDVQSL